jgi:hypothetical protein
VGRAAGVAGRTSVKDGYWLGVGVGVLSTLLVVLPSACERTDKEPGKTLVETRIDHVEKQCTDRLDNHVSRIEQLEMWAELEPPETGTCKRMLWRCPCPR